MVTEFFLFPFLLIGPIYLVWMVFYRPERDRLHKLYKETGNECMGIITQHKITHLHTFRIHEIRYAYEAPGSGRIYSKDFTTVKSEDCERQLIKVLVLPGRPESGVPDFLINQHLLSATFVVFYTFLSCILTMFSVNAVAEWIKSAMHPYRCIRIRGKLQSEGECTFAKFFSFLVTLLIMFAFGFLGALLVSSNERRKRVPGTIWSMEKDLKP